MLVRADPSTKTISLLSFPRDLDVPIYCPRTKTDTEGYVASPDDRINSAYSRCGPTGTVLTIKHLTGLPINYLITVNFHGFKEVVDTLDHVAKAEIGDQIEDVLRHNDGGRRAPKLFRVLDQRPQ